MPIDLMIKATRLLTEGHAAESIPIFNSIIVDPRSTIPQKTAAYLTRATAAEYSVKPGQLPLTDQACVDSDLQTHEWLQRHTKVEGIGADVRMNFEVRFTQGLLVAKNFGLAIKTGNETLQTMDPRFTDPELPFELRSIMAQAYEKLGDKSHALEMYQSAIQSAPNSREVPLVREAIWRITDPSSKQVKLGDWEQLLTESKSTPYAKNVYGNFAQFLESEGRLSRLISLDSEYHTLFDSTTDRGSFDSCSIDWELAVAYEHAQRHLIAYEQIRELKGRCSGNPVSQFAENFLGSHKAPVKVNSALLPLLIFVGTAIVLFLGSYLVGLRRRAT